MKNERRYVQPLSLAHYPTGDLRFVSYGKGIIGPHGETRTLEIGFLDQDGERYWCEVPMVSGADLPEIISNPPPTHGKITTASAQNLDRDERHG